MATGRNRRPWLVMFRSSGLKRACGTTPKKVTRTGDGHLLRRRAAGALQPGAPEHHEPGPHVPPRGHRAAVAHVELLPARCARAGRGDLSVRGRDQLPGRPDGQLPGAVERLLDGRAAEARPRARAGAGAGETPAESVAITTRPSSPGVHRTVRSTHTTSSPSRPESARALSQPSTKNAVDHASAAIPADATTVTDFARVAGLPVRGSTM